MKTKMKTFEVEVVVCEECGFAKPMHKDTRPMHDDEDFDKNAHYTHRCCGICGKTICSHHRDSESFCAIRFYETDSIICRECNDKFKGNDEFMAIKESEILLQETFDKLDESKVSAENEQIKFSRKVRKFLKNENTRGLSWMYSD